MYQLTGVTMYSNDVFRINIITGVKLQGKDAIRNLRSHASRGAAGKIEYLRRVHNPHVILRVRTALLPLST